MGEITGRQVELGFDALRGVLRYLERLHIQSDISNHTDVSDHLTWVAWHAVGKEAVLFMLQYAECLRDRLIAEGKYELPGFGPSRETGVQAE